MGKSAEQLNKGYARCSDHVEPRQFLRPDQRDRLIWNATPTISDVPNPPQQSHDILQEERGDAGDILITATTPPLPKDEHQPTAECNILTYMHCWIDCKEDVASDLFSMQRFSFGTPEWLQEWTPPRKKASQSYKGSGACSTKFSTCWCGANSGESMQHKHREGSACWQSQDSPGSSSQKKGWLKMRSCVQQEHANSFINIHMNFTFKEISDSFTRKHARRNRKMMKICYYDNWASVTSARQEITK